jgi:hypothetical protein
MAAFFFPMVFPLLVMLLVGWYILRRYKRIAYIRDYTFPKGLFANFEKRRQGLERKDTALAARALRKFFLAYLTGRQRFVAMPSQAVDDLWHEFILYTREYQEFCGKAFGSFLHHSPAAVLGKNKQTNEGLRRMWWQCCREENIDPRNPTRLPLLFAIDGKLKLVDGFRYAPDCKGNVQRSDNTSISFCGTSFSDSSIDGGTDGFGDSGSGGDSGGDGGGCGGGGD